MSDTKWLLNQGFEECERISSGFSLLVKKVDEFAPNLAFNSSVGSDECPDKKGLVVYYSNSHPYAEFHSKNSLEEAAKNPKISLKRIKLEAMKQAEIAPSPTTIFSLFLNGKFITTDLSACMDCRFDKVISKVLN
jgi:hypothetical protein